VLTAQILFWLIGATDGHAKNFSIFLGPGGSYRLTPLYDVLSAQPSLDARQIERKQMKLAIAVGATNHYRVDGIQRRHFIESAGAAGLAKSVVESVIEEIATSADGIMARLADELPPRFPKAIHVSVGKAVIARLRTLSAAA
jgi:serine/threonine-protein kinase HipA